MSTVEYEIHQNDEVVASVSGPEDAATAEAIHYYLQYLQDGPCEVYLVTRTRIPVERILAGRKEKTNG